MRKGQKNQNNGKNWERTLLADTFNNEIFATSGQNSVCSSQAFRQVHNIITCFGLETAEEVPKLLNEYVHYFNNRRPAATLGYKSPVQYKTELGFV